MGLLAEVFLTKEKEQLLSTTPRNLNTIDAINKCGGQAIAAKTRAHLRKSRHEKK